MNLVITTFWGKNAFGAKVLSLDRAFVNKKNEQVIQWKMR